MILADKIIKLRKEQGWSQEELAHQLQVSRQSVSKWESMVSVPDLDKILKLSQLFGVSTDYLLKDDAPRSRALLPTPRRPPKRAAAPSRWRRPTGTCAKPLPPPGGSPWRGGVHSLAGGADPALRCRHLRQTDHDGGYGRRPGRGNFSAAGGRRGLLLYHRGPEAPPLWRIWSRSPSPWPTV